MLNDQKLDAFIDAALKRPIPSEPLAQMKMYVRELAEGALAGLWEATDVINQPRARIFLEKKWGTQKPLGSVLRSYGFMVEFATLTEKAFELVEQTEPAKVFVSYRHNESSAFALLILKSLKEKQLEAFLDIGIHAGENWDERIQESIRSCDDLISILSPDTLSSQVVREEICLAHKLGKRIIPIWHNGYRHEVGKSELPHEVDKTLHFTHAIRVKEESAADYNAAIVELLNRFGITP